ncbi:uncharacterized protein LOC114654088 [Erpetoichthys calabaricus]|uniref:uncharacterized protein LOC114654088 n=1 Tax=Erpetoichthys calabaricus TaxID=27687 RepID=UPI002234CBA9|nr:uncharacterized protein LOC114654088 [Erpetoichthys calabaricus]
MFILNTVFFFFFCRMFLVVQFIDEQKSVSVIPQNWYSDGTTFWPNYTSDQRLNKAARYAEEPGPDWTKHDVRVLKSYGDYMSAWQGMKKSLICQTSELDTDGEEDIGRVKRATKPIHYYGDTDYESEHEDLAKKTKVPLTRSSKPQQSTGPRMLSPHSAPQVPSPPLPCRSPPHSSLQVPPPYQSLLLSENASQQISRNLPKMQNTSELFRPTYRVGRCGTEPIPCNGCSFNVYESCVCSKVQE